jgi:hypothetical protein
MEKANSPTENQRSSGRIEQPGINIDAVRLLVSPHASNRKPVEIAGWHESKEFLLLPSRKFDLVCRLSEDDASHRDDFLVKTTIDFLVAPPSAQFERLTPDQLGQEVSWGQVTEMHDLKSVSVYSLSPGQSRTVSIRGFDLAGVMAAFPANDHAPLWPWLMRINVYVQDRSGNEVGSTHRMFSLRPYESRIQNR